jgi:rhodanese-related sulfurtransferase
MFKNLFSPTTDPFEVNPKAFAQAVNAGEAAVADVREPHEFAAGHIPGSINLPLSRFDPRDLPNGKAVVLICQAGGRSRNALGQAHAAGRNDVKHYAGGMSQWRMIGGDVTA